MQSDERVQCNAAGHVALKLKIQLGFSSTPFRPDLLDPALRNLKGLLQLRRQIRFWGLVPILQRANASGRTRRARTRAANQSNAVCRSRSMHWSANVRTVGESMRECGYTKCTGSGSFSKSSST